MDHSSEAAPSPEAHVVRRIDTTPATNDPIPHVFVENVFPADVYAEILRQIPARAFYTPIAETGRTDDTYENRLILHFRSLDKLPSDQRRFWQAFAAWFQGSELASAVIRKFHDTLAAAIGKDLRTLSYGVEAILVKDLDGYQIGPHTDLRNRAVSLLFYLPKDDRYETYGTSFYRPRDPALRSDGSRHLQFSDFERVGMTPCRANAMLGFPRTDTSFHGVEAIRQSGIERDVLLYILRWSA
ncbi:MAG: hypothetical protein ACM30I_00680 [Gemmatimonas sp.]